MNKETALSMVVELLSLDVDDSKAITSVQYIPGDASVLSRVGSVNISGDLVSFSDSYYVVDKADALHVLVGSEFQDDKNFENYGKHNAADPICIQLSKLRIMPAYIILCEYQTFIDQNHSPERKITVWSF